MPWTAPIAATACSAPLRAPLSPKLTRELTDTTLILRREVIRPLVAHNFVRRPRTIEHVLELAQRRSPHRAARPPKNGEANGPIQRRQLLLRNGACQLFGQPQPRNAARRSTHLFDIVVDRDSSTTNIDGIGKREESRSLIERHDRIEVDR
jgi:hypothetical protein